MELGHECFTWQEKLSNWDDYIKKNDVLGRSVTFSDGNTSTNNVGTERTVSE
jgi:hypothetical protein